MPVATTQTTIGEIAARSLDAVRVFEKFGIDYCCGGKRTTEEACREKGLDLAQVVRALDEAAERNADEVDWTVAPLGELTAYIVATHHEYLKRELPQLTQRMCKVEAAHSGKAPETIGELAATLEALRNELEAHLQKEERILFPSIERYEAAAMSGGPLPAAPFGSIVHPIAVMEHDHEVAGAALARLRQLTDDYTVPEWACNTVRALWRGLAELEADTHRHIHLENNVLHPRTIALERTAR